MRYLIYLMFFLASAQAAFDIPVWSIDNGVGTARGGAYTLKATVGQSDAGTTMQNGAYRLSGGFWFPAQQHDVCLAPVIIYLLD